MVPVDSSAANIPEEKQDQNSVPLADFEDFIVYTYIFREAATKNKKNSGHDHQGLYPPPST